MVKRNKKSKKDVTGSRQVTETGKWVKQKKGQLFAPETYVDSHGVLRQSGTGLCAVWHLRPAVRARHGLGGSCGWTTADAAQIAYDEATGAPWCPQCYPLMLKERANDEAMRFGAAIAKLFGDGN